MPVLDTSFLIDLERGLPEAEATLRTLVDEGEPLLVPAQAAVEYLSGLSDEVVALHMLDSSFEVVPFSTGHIVVAARLARDCFQRGVFPGWADVQVAALALLENTPVVTANGRHFRDMGCTVRDHRK